MPEQPSLDENNEIQEIRHPNVCPFQSEAEVDQALAKIRSLDVSAVMLAVR